MHHQNIIMYKDGFGIRARRGNAPIGQKIWPLAAGEHTETANTSESLGHVLRKVRDYEVRAGALDREQRFVGDRLQIEPPVLGGGV